MSDDLFKISENQKKKQDLKKILIYGAVAFLVFVVGIVTFAILKSSNSNDNTVLPPEVQKESIFKQIPVEKKEVKIEDNPLAIDDTNVDETQPVESDNVQPAENAQNDNTIQNTNTQMPTIPSVTQTQNSQVKTVVNQKSQHINMNNANSTRGEYYIQVAALLRNKKPSKKFLETIQKDGFNYRILETYTVINNEKVKATKVLIGPFNSRAEAERNKIKVKKFITPGAFIVKVK